MPTLTDLIDEIAEALDPLRDQITDLNIYPYWSDIPTPPALDVYPARIFQEPIGFGAGNNQVFFTIRARVGMTDPTSGQQVLLRLLDPADPASVEMALKDTEFVVTDGGVSGFTQYAEDTGDQKLLGCEWRITILL